MVDRKKLSQEISRLAEISDLLSQNTLPMCKRKGLMQELRVMGHVKKPVNHLRLVKGGRDE